jgi:DNA-binding NtrC family response regulator
VTLAEFRAGQAEQMDAFKAKQRKAERTFIGKAIIATRGNVVQASRDLGVSKAALWQRLSFLNMHEWLSEVRQKYQSRP